MKNRIKGNSFRLAKRGEDTCKNCIHLIDGFMCDYAVNCGGKETRVFFNTTCNAFTSYSEIYNNNDWLFNKSYQDPIMDI